MKIHSKTKAWSVFSTGMLAGCLSLTLQGSAQAQNTLTNGLAAYWPMDIVTTNNTTPDVSHGYDMILSPNMRATNFIATPNRPTIGTLSTVSSSNCVFFNQNQAGFLYYLGSPGDLLPINLRSNYTVNMWVNIEGSNTLANTNIPVAVTNGTDIRIFAEDDFNGNSNPLWVIGTGGGGGSTVDHNAHWLRRQQSIIFPNGQSQGPDAVGTQNSAYTANNPFDGSWHMFTFTKQLTTNQGGSNVENFEVYVDTVRDPGNAGINGGPNIDAFGNTCVLTPEPVTNANNTNLTWTWLINVTSFGGLSRTISGGNFVTGLLDDAAMWNRVLTPAEMTTLYQFGLTNVTLVATPGIASFSFDNSEALYGDTDTLRWSVTHATTLTLSSTGPSSIGSGAPVNVLSLVVNGTGSTNLVITNSATYILTAGLAGNTTTATNSVSVDTRPVASGWHLIDRFDTSPLTTLSGISGDGWVNILGGFRGAFDNFTVFSTASTNPAVTLTNVLAGEAQNTHGTAISPLISGALSEYELNSLTLASGTTNTLFFRFYCEDTNIVDPNAGDFSLFIGLTDENAALNDTSQANTNNFGPKINFHRAGGPGVQINVSAFDGVTGYNFLTTNGATITTNVGFSTNLMATNPNGLSPGVVYDFWIVARIKPYGIAQSTNGSVVTTNLSGTLWDVYYAPLGGTPTPMFTGLTSDRAPFGTSPPPLAPLGRVVFALDAAAQDTSLQVVETNVAMIDDLFLSSSFNLAVPSASGIFQGLTTQPAPIRITSEVYNATDAGNGGNPSFTINWNSTAGSTYSVYRISSPVDKLVGTEVNSGGTTTSFKDTSPVGSTGLYRISSP